MNLLILGAGIQTGSALAHEGRVFLGGQYVVFVGFRNEPAFEDEGNAMDLFVLFDTNGNGICDQPDDAPNTCKDWIPVSKGDGDTVNIEAQALYLTDDAFNAPVRVSKKLHGDLKQDFFDASRYNIYMKPNVGGAYGFALTGTIKAKNGALLTLGGDQGKFVCGGGSQNPEEAFGCVGDILQPFPFGRDSNYRDDSGHRSHASERNASRMPKGIKK
ncbi:MAG: hypothetical protein ABI988_15460 [Nitrospirota bacterium]